MVELLVSEEGFTSMELVADGSHVVHDEPHGFKSYSEAGYIAAYLLL